VARGRIIPRSAIPSLESSACRQDLLVALAAISGPLSGAGGVALAGGKKAWSGKRPPIPGRVWRALGPAWMDPDLGRNRWTSERRPLAKLRSKVLLDVPDHVAFLHLAKHSFHPGAASRQSGQWWQLSPG